MERITQLDSTSAYITHVEERLERSQEDNAELIEEIKTLRIEQSKLRREKARLEADFARTPGKADGPSQEKEEEGEGKREGYIGWLEGQLKEAQTTNITQQAEIKGCQTRVELADATQNLMEMRSTIRKLEALQTSARRARAGRSPIPPPRLPPPPTPPVSTTFLPTASLAVEGISHKLEALLAAIQSLPSTAPTPAPCDLQQTLREFAERWEKAAKSILQKIDALGAAQQVLEPEPVEQQREGNLEADKIAGLVTAQLRADGLREAEMKGIVRLVTTELRADGNREAELRSFAKLVAAELRVEGDKQQASAQTITKLEKDVKKLRSALLNRQV